MPLTHLWNQFLSYKGEQPLSYQSVLFWVALRPSQSTCSFSEKASLNQMTSFLTSMLYTADDFPVSLDLKAVTNILLKLPTMHCGQDYYISILSSHTVHIQHSLSPQCSPKPTTCIFFTTVFLAAHALQIVHIFFCTCLYCLHAGGTNTLFRNALISMIGTLHPLKILCM